MTDINNLTDDQLAKACDLYISRVVSRLSGVNHTKWMFVSAHRYTYETEYNIKHQLEVNGVKLEGSNLLELADKFISIEQIKTAPVTVVAPMLEAPKQEYTEFTAVDDHPDNIPF